MKIKTYHIEFNSFREGKNYSLEQTVEAADIYDAMKIVENYCCDNYGTCEITSVKKVDKNTFTCEVCKRKYQWASPCTPDDCEDRFKDFLRKERSNRGFMIRDTFFRGKRKDTGEWIEGYLFKSWDRTFLL